MQHYKSQRFLSHDHEHAELEDAPDTPPTRLITSVVLLSFAFVFAVWFIAYPLGDQFAEMRKDKIDLGQGNPERLDYLKQKQKVLSSYQKLENGYFQVPIEEAMKVVVEKQGNVF